MDWFLYDRDLRHERVNYNEYCITVAYQKNIKGTVMQFEKALIIDRFRVSKASRKLRIPAIYNFAVIYP